MIEESAQVIEVSENQVLLQTQRQSACQSCSVKAGCGTSTLASVVGTRSSQFSVKKTFELAVGDRVIVAVDENALVQGSLLIYLFPLVFMMFSGAVAEYFFAVEWLTILSVVGGFIFAMFVVRFVFNGSALKKAVQPHLLRKA